MPEGSGILSREECERQRTPRQFKHWIEEILARFGATPEGRRAYRLRDDKLIKRFVEELLPLNHFLTWKYSDSPSVLCAPCLGDQPVYDAILTHSSCQPPRNEYLQITLALSERDGRDGRSRRAHFAEHLSVPMTGKVFKKKGRPDGVVGQLKTVDYDERVSKALTTVTEAARRKGVKPLFPGTSLLIVFDDCPVFREEDDLARLKAHVKAQVKPLLSDFKALYLVGKQGRYMLEVQLQG